MARTLSKNERTYIDAHKHDAEDALRLLITDINTAKREVASYAMAFSGIAEFITEALATDDPIEKKRKLEGVIQVCHNFSVPINSVYEGLRSIGNFDPGTPTVKNAKKRPTK